MSGARRSPVPAWVPNDLPAAPGVYEFADANGTPLYVGKSVNLKRRVRGYFYGGGPADERMAEMLRLARRVTIAPAGSDLEARLEEADRIERHRPPYNRVGKNRSRGWYLEIDWGVPFPRLRVARSARRARARYFGPFRGRRLPTEAAALVERIFRLRTCAGFVRPDPEASPCLQHGIGLCTAPCARLTGLDAYRRQVRDAERLLEDPGFAAALRDRFRSERESARARGDGPAAADWERRLVWAAEFESYRRALERPWVDRSWLIVLPGAASDEAVLVPVARGRVLPRRRLRRRDPDAGARVRDACYDVRLAELRLEAVFPPAELAPSLLVTGWLEEGAPGGLAVELEDWAGDDGGR
ncbi:MAG: hypothetical protein ACE5HF_10795, partial [Gemmatimonadota bacterium]